MKKIKNYFIKLLGGYTHDEYREGLKNHWLLAKKTGAEELRLKADELYGTNSDKWASKMYYQICNMSLTGYCVNNKELE